MTLAEATKLSLEILKQVMEEKISASNVEVATITLEDGFKIMAQDGVNDILATLDA